MRFSFKSLPKMVFVGTYVLEVNAVDEVGQPIACARGSLSIQAGKSRGVLRKLESGCPDFIMDNWHDIDSLSVTECDSIDYRNINVNMKPGLDYYLIGHWREYCKDGSHRLTVYRRHPDLWKMCTSQEECDFGCGAICQDDSEGTWKCIPQGESECEQQKDYDISPEEVQESCHEGGGTMISAAAALPGVAGKLAAASLLAFLATHSSLLH